ncbi:MAG: hypothetical protein AB8F94_06135 [Saprospiraceae bacterium]
MKQDWLDNNLDNKLGDYDSPMDFESAWESLQAKRQAPKKKKKFFFFWIIFGLFLTGAGGSYFLLNDKTDNNYNNIITDTKNSLETESQPSGKISTTSPTLSNSKKTNQNNVDTKINTKTKINQNATINKSDENQNYSNLKEAKSGVEKNASFSNTKNNNIITSDENLDFSKKSNSNLIFPKQNVTEKAIKNTVLIDSTTSQKVVEPIALLFLPSLETRLLKLAQPQNLEKIDANFSELDYSLFDESDKVLTKLKPKNYLVISGGYGNRSQGKVMAAENSLDVMSVNALFEKRFSDRRIYLKTGINFDQFVNSIETKTEELYTQQLENQLITVNHFHNGTSQDVYGMADVPTIERTTSNNFNRYRLISIPMIVGYDLISRNRMSLQVEGGMARSILGLHSGKDFDLIESGFENQGVWQGIYGLNFNVRTGARTNIFTSFKGNYHFNKIGVSDELEMEKFRFHQIQVGLRFKL